MFNHSAVQGCITFLNDIPRNTWYRDNIQKIVAGKTVMEIGCGAGLLAAYALENGAKHYYGIDIRSNRVNFTKDLLEELGYKHQSTVWTDDFCQLVAADIPGNIDILLCEQTGHQFQNNFTIQKFWQHANDILGHNYISLPNEWGIDVEVYAGEVPDNELKPSRLLDDQSLPGGYVDFVKKSQPIKTVDVIMSALSITPAVCDQPISFVVDLRDYTSATVLISDYIAYCDHRCNSISATTDWPGPIKIVVPDAGSFVRFTWDSNLRKLPDYTKGFWTYEHV